MTLRTRLTGGRLASLFGSGTLEDALGQARAPAAAQSDLRWRVALLDAADPKGPGGAGRKRHPGRRPVALYKTRPSGAPGSLAP